MDRSRLLSALSNRFFKVQNPLSLVYEPMAESVGNTELQLEIYTALSEAYCPAVYSGSDDPKHRVTVQSGLKDVDKVIGGLSGFIEITGNGFNNGLRLIAGYSLDASKQGLNTLLLTPSRAKSAYFHSITQRWGDSVHSLLITSFTSLFQTLISLKNSSLIGDLVIIDGLSTLFLSGNGIPSDGRDEYLSALISEIKAVSRDRTIITLVGLTAEGKPLGLAGWLESGQRSMRLTANGHQQYVLEEVTDRVSSVSFSLL